MRTTVRLVAISSTAVALSGPSGRPAERSSPTLPTANHTDPGTYLASSEREVARVACANTCAPGSWYPWVRRPTTQNHAPASMSPKLATSEAMISRGRAPSTSSTTSAHSDRTTHAIRTASPAR